jgi:hypothetical protein
MMASSLSWVMLLTCPAILAGQTRHAQLLELYTRNVGQCNPLPGGRTLYAVVFDDGDLKYIDTSKNSDDGLAVKYQVLTAPELTVLQQRLGSEVLRQFTGIINAEHQVRPSDCQTVLEVSIPRDNTVQQFVMRGFDAMEGRPFPKPINGLLCAVDDFTHYQYRLSSNCTEQP